MPESSAVPPTLDAVRPFEVRATHLELLAPLERLAVVDDMASPGIVVVPATRDNRLTTGAQLARSLGWPLLVLCSRGLEAPVVRARLAAFDDVALTAADLMSSSWLRAPRSWLAVEHRAALQRIRIDTNRKRNLALLSAAMLGLRWTLFVDDDVSRLTPRHVEAAIAHLVRRHEHHVVGWPYTDFPDNSVVHHARRDVMGWTQDVFVAGGALLVDLASRTPAPFPPVYNEDWLFLFDALAQGRIAVGPPVHQQEYDPYDHPSRAGLEEFGDVLGEGLFHLLHEKAPVETAFEPLYWTTVLAKRQKLLGRLTERARELSASEGPDGRAHRVVLSMTEARRQHSWVTAASLADFVRRWRHDQETWADFYERLPPRDTLKDALVYLGLDESWIVTAGPRH